MATNKMSRFYLTTAIDYVNSRPHLGTAYEKIAADVIARYKRLAGFETRFPDGQRRALAERLQEGAGGGAGPARVLRRDGAGVPQDLGAARRLLRRFHPDHRAAAPGGRARRSRSASTTPATSTKASTRAGTASAARSSSRRRISSTATARCTRRSSPSGSARRTTSSGCRSISSRCSIISPRTPSSSQPEVRRNEILRLDRGRPDRHLRQPRRPVVGHPAAVRSRERRLRLVRRADQLRLGGRARRRSGSCSRNGGRPTCTSSARTSRGSTR